MIGTSIYGAVITGIYNQTHNTNSWKQLGNHESKKPIPASLTDMWCDAHCLFRLLWEKAAFCLHVLCGNWFDCSSEVVHQQLFFFVFWESQKNRVCISKRITWYKKLCLVSFYSKGIKLSYTFPLGKKKTSTTRDFIAALQGEKGVLFDPQKSRNTIRNEKKRTRGTVHRSGGW